MKKIFFLCVILSFAFMGCGGSSGSTTQLTTVFLTATPSSDRLEVDVLTENSCTTGGGTYITETIPITVTSTAYPNATVKSPVTINSIKISYSKYDTKTAVPTLPMQFDTGSTINPGESKTFNVKVAPDKLKLDLVENFAFNLCSLDYWEYYATITFTGVENYTDQSISFNTVVKVAFADRNNI